MSPLSIGKEAGWAPELVLDDVEKKKKSALKFKNLAKRGSRIIVTS
jgi:hypothetical protein